MTAAEETTSPDVTSAGTTAWVDLASPCHPFLFAALVDELSVGSQVTVREKTETVGLAEAVGFEATVLGRDFDNVLLRKVGIPFRTLQLSLLAPTADVSLSARNAMCVLASKAQGIPSIHFTDNDITAHVDGLPFERLYNRLEAMATYNVVPSAFETAELTRHGADEASVYTYDGYKEDVYVAALTPDESFTDRLPFEEYIVVRPEALGAAYVDGADSLVPDLFEQAVGGGLNVVYLPRGRDDRLVAAPYPDDRVYIPGTALDGLQLSWHAQCVLTGSGTMAREAACMQKPAVSFFPNTLLSVDQELVSEGRMFHSRDPDAIVDHVLSRSSADVAPDLSESKRVRAEVADLVRSLVARHA